MTAKKYFLNFWRTFFHVRVSIFIFIGTAIIFLTFFTTSNALEIAISGIASVFIGIGVNNFSMLETHEKDSKRLKAKMLHAVKTFEFLKARINKLHKNADTRTSEELKQSLEDLEQLILLSISLIDERDVLE